MSSDYKALVSSRLFYQGQLIDAAVVYKQGVIRSICDRDQLPNACKMQDVGDRVIMPGLVDTHVHINEPGRTDWEGFNTATQAAAAGGITSVIDMPLNCIPVTTTLEAFKQKLKACDQQLWVDVGFHGGIIPGNSSELKGMVDAGIKTFKAFMIDSGIEEFPASDYQTLDTAMPTISQLGATLLVHAEVDLDEGNPVDVRPEDVSRYQYFLDSRPDQWEVSAIEQIITLAEKHQCRVHIVHLSSAKALDMIAKAREKGVSITAETCPHYLTLSADSIPDGDARFKCCPPIRNTQNQDLLWAALEDNLIDFIVSDHSPCTADLKKLAEHDLWHAWGGISSLQFGLSLIWTAMKMRGYGLDRLVDWMCTRPAFLVGLETRKGQIEVGFDADFVIWDPEENQTISTEKILHKNKATAYQDVQIKGRVYQTILRGQLIYDVNEAQNFTGIPQGQTIL